MTHETKPLPETKALLIEGKDYKIVDFPTGETEQKLDWYYGVLDCQCIDIVTPHGLDDLARTAGLKNLVGEFCLITDDEALLVADPQVNPIASLLYGSDLHGQLLFGKVLVAKNQMRDDGIETVGLNKLDIMQVLSAINALITVHNEKVAAD